jgi:alkylation response protein AidB-like acyl-CoA dehydrogenase
MTDQSPIAATMPASAPGDYYDLNRIRPEVLAALEKINAMGPAFAARAKSVDDEASFPTENYRDLADAGFLGLSIPQEFGAGALPWANTPWSAPRSANTAAPPR